MRIAAPIALYVAAEEFAVAQEIEALLGCVTLAEESAGRLLTNKLRGHAPSHTVPAVPSLPGHVDATTVVAYLAGLRVWLGAVRRLLKRDRKAAMAMALAAAADDRAPPTATQMTPEEMTRYLCSLDMSAKLLAFYCQAMAL
jgi:hypothetical protein